MRTTFFSRLAPLLAMVAAFAVMPAAAQAVPHWYSNLAKIEEGRRVPYIEWGKLSLGPDVAPAECENAVGGYIENPVGGGAGRAELNGWTAYNCHDEECNYSGGHFAVTYENERTPGINTRLEWPGELTEAHAGTIRLKGTSVRVYAHCQLGALAPTERAGTGSYEGLEERESTEYNTPGSTTCTTASPGSWEPRWANGTNAEKPSKAVFEPPGEGQLECGTGGKGLWGGTLKVVGFSEAELLSAKNP